MRYDDFFKFCIDRHDIYLRRASGAPWPWTEDPIFQQFSFTNIYRELDKTTVWFRDNVRDLNSNSIENSIWGTVLFRWFNRIEIGKILLDHNNLFLSHNWNAKTARMTIRAKYPAGPWATGAYIVKTPVGKDKLSGIIDCADGVWQKLPKIIDWFKEQRTLEEATKYFTQFDHLGWFMSYEIVSDLRHTVVLRNAPDIMTWANPGPGANRGAARVIGADYRTNLLREKVINIMRDLLEYSRKVDLPPMEMRDIEHSLCEFDKYERTRTRVGRPRNIFTPPHLRK